METDHRDRCKFFQSRWRTALVALCIALAGCGGGQHSLLSTRTIHVGSELAADQVLNRHLEGDPRTIDPTLATDMPSQPVLDDLFEGLVALSADGRIVPGVASSWETSADGKTWTFHLRADARWSNGEPVTADDFVYAWRREVDPATGSEYSQALAPIENALDAASGKVPPSKLGVESAGPRTVVVHLRQPTAYLPALLTNAYLMPLYAPPIKQWGDGWTQGGRMISNGAYQLVERVINGHIALTANPYYWNAKQVIVKKVNYLPVSDFNSAIDQYLAGNLDITNRITPSRKELLQRALGSQVVLAPSFATAMFGFNFTKPPFAGNTKLRLALSMALDREILMTYVQRGIGLPAYNIMPPLPGYEPAVPDWARLSPEDRHALARKLYHDAGYSDAHPLETIITVQTAGAEFRRFMEAASTMWLTNLGAKVQLYAVEWKILLQARQLKQPVFYWDAWNGDFPDPDTFMQIRKTGNGMNNGGYSNPEFDALVERANADTNNAERMELFHQAEAILNADAPFVPVYYYVNAHLIKPYVQGWKSNISDRHLSKYLSVLAHQED